MLNNTKRHPKETSLYLNTPVLQSKEAVKASLVLNIPQIRDKPSNKTLLELLALVLAKTNFQLNGHHYIQVRTKLASMGSSVSPILAILYRGDFEKKYVYTYNLQLLNFSRYIDDIFMIWPHTLQELDIFIDHPIRN